MNVEQLLGACPATGPILLLLQAPPHRGLSTPPPPPSYLTTQNFTPLNCCCSHSTYMYVGQKRFLPVAPDNRRSYSLVAWQPQCPPPKGLVLSTSGCQQNDLDIKCPPFCDFCRPGDHAAWNKREAASNLNFNIFCFDLLLSKYPFHVSSEEGL